MLTYPDPQRQESQKQKLQALGQLAGGVAHDFNNILSIIEGYARILEKQSGPHSPTQEKIRHILTATKRGAGLTRQLLAFGRQQILPVTQCDLPFLVSETQSLLRPLVTNRIRLTVHVPEEEIFIPCDPDMVTQILINLVVNARDSIEDSGDIWVDVTATPHKAILMITDNGSGMEPEIAARVFEPFFTTKEQGKGTGLGLSMIAGYMQQIGGHVNFDTHLHEGTTFTLSFPRKVATAAPDISPAHPPLPITLAPLIKQPTKIPLAKKTILVVDDEEALLPVLEQQLNELGLKVLKAANADNALFLQNVYRDPIHLLLTDVVMPGISGVKLAEKMKRLRPDTGVVFMTGYPDRGGIPGSPTALPPDALVLQKPLPPEELSPALQKALARLRDKDI